MSTTEVSKTKKIINFINGFVEVFWGVANPFFQNIFDLLDEGKVLKRFSVLAGIALTVYCVQWSFQFAITPPNKYTGSDVAMIIGAILSPVALLTGALMKYGDDLYKTPPKPPTYEDM